MSEKILTRKVLTRKYRNVNEMIEDGWSKLEIDELVKAPRTRPAEGSDTNFRWPEIDGINVTGLYSVLTTEEKAMYQHYRKMTRKEGSGSSIFRNQPAKKVDEETMAKWEKLLAVCENDEKAKALVLELMPKSSEEMLLQKVTGLNKTDVTGGKSVEVSLHYLMFRGPNGEFAEDKTVGPEGVAKLIIEGWLPMASIDEITSNLVKLNNYGFAVTLKK